MSRFQGDDLLQMILGELFNFVNLGECEGAVVSLIWPFDDIRHRPLFLDVSRSLSNMSASRAGWPRRWPRKVWPEHVSLQLALRAQLERMAAGMSPELPIWPGWTRRGMGSLPATEAATLTAVRAAFDEVLRAAMEDEFAVSRCKDCGGFFLPSGGRGRPPHFCNSRHAEEYRKTPAFKQAQARSAREGRAREKLRAEMQAQAVVKNSRKKSRI